GGLLAIQPEDSEATQPSISPSGIPKPTAYFEVNADSEDLQPGVSRLQFKFANIPKDFYVDKVLLRVKTAGPSIQISKSPSFQVKPVKVSKVVSVGEIEDSPHNFSVTANLAHDPSEPIAMLVVSLS